MLSGSHWQGCSCSFSGFLRIRVGSSFSKHLELKRFCSFEILLDDFQNSENTGGPTHKNKKKSRFKNYSYKTVKISNFRPFFGFLSYFS